MQILGLQKTTLLDYPGYMAATIFLGGCNFRCPFCHNKELVLCPQTLDAISQEELFSFLKKRKSLLDGVCITGGEPLLPTLEAAEPLIDFFKKIKELSYKIKLDTNGFNPELLQFLMENHLIDYVAMDIKSSLSGYAQVTGLDSGDWKNIMTSIKILMNSPIPYEFRTTLVQELHSKKDMEEIGGMIAGAKQYFLQNYVDGPMVINPGFHPLSTEEMKEFLSIVQIRVPYAKIRGMEV